MPHNWNNVVVVVIDCLVCQIFLMRDQFEERVLCGYWIALTLAKMRIVLWACNWCLFRITSSILMAGSRAHLDSTVHFKSSFCISGTIKLVIKTSLISVSSFFEIKNFRYFFKFSIKMLDCFSSEFFSMRKTCLSNVMCRDLRNASSTIFQISTREL